MPTRLDAHLRHSRYYETALYLADQLYQRGGRLIEVALRILDKELENI